MHAQKAQLLRCVRERAHELARLHSVGLPPEEGAEARKTSRAVMVQVEVKQRFGRGLVVSFQLMSRPRPKIRSYEISRMFRRSLNHVAEDWTLPVQRFAGCAKVNGGKQRQAVFRFDCAHLHYDVACAIEY